MAIFPSLFFRQYRPRKCLLWYSRTKKRLSRLWKQEVQTLEKLIFLKGVNPWFWSENGLFSHSFFFVNIGQENVFYDILEQKKTPFQAIKTRSSNRRKIDIFQMGLTHGFGPKIAIFPTFFLGNKGQENEFYDILERKNAFLRYKKKKFKQSKNWRFSKGVKPW